MAQQINTIIVLRNDSTTNWASSSYVLLSGEVGVGYMTVEKTVNGETKNVKVPIIKVGDGVNTWENLPQAEGVFEDDLTLTYNFGRYTTNTAGYVEAGGKGMTTSEWLTHALSNVQNPTVTEPKCTLSASGTGAGGEIGSYITKLNWDGTTTYGSYTWGPATGLSASNRTWSISNNIDDQTSTKEDGSFDLGDNKIQLTQEASKKYATITGEYSIDASSAAYGNNNVGKPSTKKVSDKSGTLNADVYATAYRKPFYGVLPAGQAIDVNNLSSDVIRSLPKSGSSNAGVPSGSTYLSVPVGSEMVIFAMKAGTKSKLVATDNKAMNAEVGFTKVANAVRVKGANGFVTSTTGDAANGELYDIWYVNWNPDKVEGYAGIGSAKELKLTWS